MSVTKKANEAEYTVINLFGKKCLLTTYRIDKKSIPEGLHCNDISSSQYDDGEPGNIEEEGIKAHSNYYGAIISKEGYKSGPVTSDDFEYTYEELTLEEYMLED